MSGYGEAKDVYWNLGWPAPLPLEAGTKWPPPVGFSGNKGRYPQYNDLVMWEQMSKYRDGNICLRLPCEIEIDRALWCIIGVDVDGYDSKTGARTLAEAERRFGPLPPTYRATSRTDGVSGIRLFLAPAGTRLHGDLKFPELGFGDIEFIQFHHRYVVCWPSIHDKTGQMYLWYYDGPEGLVVVIPPAPGDLPVLPQPWIDANRVDTRRNDSKPAGETKGPNPKRERSVRNVIDAMTGGQPSPKVAQRLGKAIADLQGPSRRDATLRHVMALLCYGRNGEPGVERALVGLYRAFTETVGADRVGGEAEAMAEFERKCSNAETLLADSHPPAPKRVQWGAARQL